jgi:hypothetical protein
MSRILACAVLSAALAFPLAANAQDGAGASNWANAGGTDPARDLVGLGTRVFDRGYLSSPPVYTSTGRYDAQRPPAGRHAKK